MPPIFLALILVLFAVAFGLLMHLSAQLSNAPGITRKYRNSREHISLSSSTRKKGYFEWLFGPPNVERVLANLPSTLLTLDVSGTDIVRLPDLPAGLVKLVARDCKNLEAIDRLPDSLRHLDLWGCEKLTRLPEQLPSSLQEAWFVSLAITRLPRLPENVESVDARCCPNLVETSSEWPRFSSDGGKLHWLNLCNTPALQLLSGNLPESARRELRVHGCTGYRYNSLFGNMQFAGQPPGRQDKCLLPDWQEQNR